MIEVDLKAGDIFTWQNYPLSMDKSKERRWFLYLGNNSIEAIVYQITTTTQYQHYASEGNRKGNNHFELPVGMGGLEAKSILDLSFFETIPEQFFNKHKDDINKKGTLSSDYVNRFVKFLNIDRNIQTIIKKDICRSLREAGFKIA